MLSRFAAIERASIDEAYLDLTGSARERLRALRGCPLAAALLPTTFVQGLPDDAGPQPGGKGTRGLGPAGLRPPGPALCAPRRGGSNGSALRPLNAAREGRSAATPGPPVLSLSPSTGNTPCTATEVQGGLLSLPRNKNVVNRIYVFFK